MKPPEAVVFDLDGTLLDTERPYRVAFQRTVAAWGLAMPDEAYAALVGLSSRERTEHLRSRFGLMFDTERFLADYRGRREALLRGGAPLRPGAADVLEALRAGGIPLAIATSASRTTAHSRLIRAGLASYFTAVVTRDDVDRGKPCPDVFETAAEALDVPPRRCLAIEDSHHGIRAAHLAGMTTIMVVDLLPPAPEIVGLCAAVISDLTALLTLLPTAPQPNERLFVHDSVPARGRTASGDRG